MRAACLWIALAFTSCGGEPGPTRPEPPAADTAEATRPTEERAQPTTVPSGTQASSAPPTLAFVATTSFDGVALSVANHGTSDVALRTSVAMEVETNGVFAAGPSGAALALRYDCEHAQDDCVTLAPGGELLPPSCASSSVPTEPGSYRLVVTTCDGAHRVESNAFALPWAP